MNSSKDSVDGEKDGGENSALESNHNFQFSIVNYQLLLNKYWGYDDFRGIQREIIESICSGHDTLGLMPTGGGKSITFQVPALAQKGVCIVITPLIALMKDQVDNLLRRGIKAAAIYSGLTHEEIIITLENCIFGDVKLLYVSPERLSSELFQTKLRHMKVSFITVDEAHCISQWGYDFRPSYLEIANIRKLLPGVPVLALTATATPQVVEDICEKLSNHKVLGDAKRQSRAQRSKLKVHRPLFAFGHGLSYTTFKLGKLIADKNSMTEGDEITFTIPVTNTGSMAGAETVQLYISDLEASVERPVKELKAFQKVFLQPGETQQVSLTIDKGALSFYDEANSQWKAEPGTFEALVGTASDKIISRCSFTLQ